MDFLEAATAIKKMGDALRKSDNSWYDRGERPPVGINVEFKYKADKVWVGRTCMIIAVYGSQFWALLDGNRSSNLYELNKFDFRPIQTERELLIDIIISTGNLSEGELADVILAAGFTNNKGEIN